MNCSPDCKLIICGLKVTSDSGAPWDSYASPSATDCLLAENRHNLIRLSWPALASNASPSCSTKYYFPFFKYSTHSNNQSSIYSQIHFHNVTNMNYCIISKGKPKDYKFHKCQRLQSSSRSQRLYWEEGHLCPACFRSYSSGA